MWTKRGRRQLDGDSKRLWRGSKTLSGFFKSAESSLDETGTEQHLGLDVQECIGFGKR